MGAGFWFFLHEAWGCYFLAPVRFYCYLETWRKSSTTVNSPWNDNKVRCWPNWQQLCTVTMDEIRRKLLYCRCKFRSILAAGVERWNNGSGYDCFGRFIGLFCKIKPSRQLRQILSKVKNCVDAGGRRSYTALKCNRQRFWSVVCDLIANCFGHWLIKLSPK